MDMNEHLQRRDGSCAMKSSGEMLDDSISGYSALLQSDELDNPVLHRLITQPVFVAGELRTENGKKREIYEQMKEHRNAVQVLMH